MEIDKNAPLSARKTCVIDVSVGTVWSLLTDIEDWPAWQSDISSAKLDGDLKVGTQFFWKAKGLNINSTIKVLNPHVQIGWTGKSLGMNAIHLWNFKKLEPSKTQVITEESLAGWFPKTIKIVDPLFLEKSLTNSLEVLKNTAEKRGKL